jgi:hypothetical protein
MMFQLTITTEAERQLPMEGSLVSDLIESNADFRALLQKSAASPRKPFDVETQARTGR